VVVFLCEESFSQDLCRCINRTLVYAGSIHRWEERLRQSGFLLFKQWQSSIIMGVDGNGIFLILTTDLGNSSSALLSCALLVVSSAEKDNFERLADRDITRICTYCHQGWRSLYHSSPQQLVFVQTFT
jgi:hypothetical protein